MTILRRVVLILAVIGLVAGMIYAAEQVLQPALASALGRNFEHGMGRGRTEIVGETYAEQAEGRFGRPGARRGEGGRIFDEHFRPVAGLIGLGNDLLMVGAVAVVVVGVDYGLSRALRHCRRQRVR